MKFLPVVGSSILQWIGDAFPEINYLISRVSVSSGRYVRISVLAHVLYSVDQIIKEGIVVRRDQQGRGKPLSTNALKGSHLSEK